MTGTKTTCAAVANRARFQAITRLGRLFKCTPQKAEERMLRPNPKYVPYRVAFSNFIDEAITNVFAHIDNGQASLLPMHWSAVKSGDADVESKLGRLYGEVVCYWVPKREAA